MTDSTFNNNIANQQGGGICWASANGTLINSKFTNNAANRHVGDAIYWNLDGLMINCTFNSKWINSNGVYANNNLNLNGGKGIVDLFVNGALSGISIVVLNNETYYYPPNTNINLTNKLKSNLKTKFRNLIENALTNR